MPALQNISIVGSGSWATALVKIFTESGIRVTWCVRSSSHADYILRHNRPPRHLSYIQLEPGLVSPVTSVNEAIEAADHIIVAVPSAYLEASLQDWQGGQLPEGKRLLVSVKGVLPSTGELPTHFLSRIFEVPVGGIFIMGGPCHAEEVAMGRRTYLTLAGNNAEELAVIASSIRPPYMRVICNNDPAGVELAAIMKNVVGIAAGIIRGLNYGDNFLAVVVSNAMREVRELLSVISPLKRDLNDSAYFGDLLVTAYSAFSRNGSFGRMIGRGYSVPVALQGMPMMAEGYPAARGLFRLAENAGLQLPLLSAVYRILYRQSSPYNELKLLERFIK